MLRRIEFQLVTVDACSHCVSKCVGVCVKWITGTVSNQCFLPQGGQGPKWSDIRLRASTGFIEWYVSEAELSFAPFLLFLSLPHISLSSFILLSSLPPPFYYSQSASFLSPPTSSHLPSCYKPLLPTILWFKQLPNLSKDTGCGFIFIPE